MRKKVPVALVLLLAAAGSGAVEGKADELSKLAHLLRACPAHEYCVRLGQCSVVARDLRGQELSAEQKTSLRDKQCAWDADGHPMVCCPVLTDTCGPVNTTDLTLSGRLWTAVEEFPWVAQLFMTSKDILQFVCEGTLISDRYVITAAHCLNNKKGSIKMVRLGEHDETSDPDCETFGDVVRYCAPRVTDVAVEEQMSHPEFKFDPEKPTKIWNDIGLVRLAESVAFSESVQPACLPLPEYAREQRTPYWVAVGWTERDNDNSREGNQRLRKIEMKEVSHERCVRDHERIGAKLVLSQERQFCAESFQPGQERCRGFSGSPLTVVTRQTRRLRSVVEGVLSYGVFIQNDTVAVVFTRVAHHVPWILNTIRP